MHYIENTPPQKNVFTDAVCLWGGKSKPHSDAQEDLWRKMQKFIRERIPCTGKLNELSKL